MAGKKEIKLVPTEEQPYEIPENWCWTYLGNLVSASKERTEDFSNPSTRYVGLEHMEKDAGIVGYSSATEIKSLKSVFHKGQILYGKLRPYLNKHDVATFDGVCSTDILVFDPSKAVFPEYINLFLSQRNFIEYAVANSKGINLPRVSESIISDAPCPLAPLAEQKRIVDTIVDLFADLDKAAENAERIVKQHDERRANLLHSAITGELTDTWRKSHGVDITDWTSSTIDDLCYSLKYGTAKKSKSAGPVVVLRMGNMQEGEIDWTDLAYTDDGEDIAKYHLEPGDVLFNRTNSATHVGKTSIYRGEYPAIYAGYLIKLDYDHSRVIGNYLTYALNTPTAREYCQSVKTDGVNQSNINARKIGAFSIPLPSMEEQQEIVRILDELLGNEQRIKEAAEEMLDKIAMMKKSILADAFRGKLGTNDPADEPATELLRQILA